MEIGGLVCFTYSHPQTQAADAVAARKGDGDATITMIAHFNDRLPPEQLLVINYRLMALAMTHSEG
jgi:hypothetical protein